MLAHFPPFGYAPSKKKHSRRENFRFEILRNVKQQHEKEREKVGQDEEMLETKSIKTTIQKPF